MRLISKYKTEGRLIPKAQYGVKVPDTVLNYWRKQGIALPPSRNEQISADNRTKELKEAQERDANTRQLGNTIKQFGIDTRNQLGTMLSYVNPSFGLALGLGDAGISTLNGNYIEGGIQAGLEALPFIGKTVNKLLPKETTNIFKSIVSPSNSKRLIKESEVPMALMKAKQESKSFFSNPVIEEADRHNRQIFKRVAKVDGFGEGITDTRKYLADRPINKNPETDFIYSKPSSTTAARMAKIEGLGKTDVIQLNMGNPQNFEEAVENLSHEIRHHGYYGEAPMGHPNRDRINKFYKWKINKLYKPREQVSKEDLLDFDYLVNNQAEGYNNAIDIGNELGLQLGQQYPGKNKVLDLLNNYTGRKGFVVGSFDTSTTPHVKRVWDAMTGRYVIVPVVGNTLNDKNK